MLFLLKIFTNKFVFLIVILLNSFIFLFSISISALVVPSILPKTTLIGVVLLTFGLIINLYQSSNHLLENNKMEFIGNINYGNIAPPIVGIFLLLTLFTARSFSEEANLVSNFGLLALHAFFLLFIINTKDYLQTYIKAYILFVFLMSVSGLVATAIVSLDLINISYTNINDLTNGSFTRDQGMEQSYIFPYNLGFVLSAGGKLNLLGYEFFRISGWAHEPTSATLFIAPAIILMLHTKIIRNLFFRTLITITILSFWFFSMSVGSLLAFISLYSFVLVLTLYTKIFPLKLTVSIVFFLVMITLLVSFYIEPLLNSSIFSTKFDMEAETFQIFISELLWFIPNSAHDQIFYFTHLSIWALIMLFLFIILFSLSKEKLNIYALILLYIVIHGMKGSQTSIYTHIFVFFWFYVAYFSVSGKQGNIKS